ncbi:MAG: hypothetical protein WB789_10190 [Thermoplasmata archaeon]
MVRTRTIHRLRRGSLLPALLTGAVTLVLLTVIVAPSGSAALLALRAEPPRDLRSASEGPRPSSGGDMARESAKVAPPYDGGTPAVSDPPYWSNISALGATAPGATIGGALAFDPAANTTVFLGGDSTPSFGKFWTYNNYTWAGPSNGIPDLFAALAYDGSDSELIAFGGQAQIAGNPGGGPTIPTNATYGFSEGTWTNLTPTLSVSPPASALPMMAADPANGSAVLLDPVGSANRSQTWSFANGTWTNLTATAGQPPPGPSGADSVMTYDPAAGGVAFFGGSFPNSGYGLATNETWEFRDGRWTDLNLVGPDFTTGAVQTLAFDAATNALEDLVAPSYLYSENGSADYEDWEFLGGAWANQTAHLPATPPIGYDPLSVWDPADGYLLYISGGFDDQSWAFGTTPLHAQVSVLPSPVDVGYATTFRVVVSGGSPPLRYSYSGLPPGCVSSSVPILSCQPSGPGNFTVQVSVEDYSNASVNASAGLEVGSRLSASGPLLSPGTSYVGSTVTFSVAVSGGVLPYAFAWSVPVVNCTPPDAAQFTCGAGQTGPFGISVNVTDATAIGFVAVEENVTVVGYPAIISFAASPTRVEVGGTFDLNTSVAGGAPALVYNYSGLPPGCQGSSKPSMTCGPTGPGTFNITVAVTDGLGSTVRATVEVSVVAALAILGEEITPNPATVGSVVTFSYAVSGGAGPFHSGWTDLPPGCVPSQTAFVCAMNTTGSFDVGLTVRDALGGVARANLTLTIPMSGGPSETRSGWELVPLWAWAAVGLGVFAVAGLLLWDRQRRRSSPAPNSGPADGGFEGIEEVDGPGSPDGGPNSAFPESESGR